MEEGVGELNAIIRPGPMLLANVYPWFNPDRWVTEPPHDLPLIGMYDSIYDVARLHIAELQHAGFDGGLLSYWPGQHERARGVWARAAEELEFPWCSYLEVSGRSDEDIGRMLSEINAMRSRYAMYMHTDGRPQVFAFSNDQPDEAYVARWEQFVNGGFWVSLKADPRLLLPPNFGLVDAVHPYQPTIDWLHVRSTEEHAGAVGISPGFWISNAKTPTLERDLARFRYQLLVALHPSGPREPYVIVTSFNEFAEGTHIEPSETYGWSYLLAVREVRTFLATGRWPGPSVIS